MELVRYSETVDFQKCLDDIEAGPITKRGNQFSWSNKMDAEVRVYSHIDRVFEIADWKLKKFEELTHGMQKEMSLVEVKIHQLYEDLRKGWPMSISISPTIPPASYNIGYDFLGNEVSMDILLYFTEIWPVVETKVTKAVLQFFDT
ncbi:hypothetical protein HAX54_038150, partial [Datura stramonium]|nr:hypothetical protein [Datura stramonium]